MLIFNNPPKSKISKFAIFFNIPLAFLFSNDTGKIIQKFLKIYWTNYYDLMEPFFDWMKSCLDMEEKGQK